VLVLTTAAQIEDAGALADPSAWRVLEPWMPLTGAGLEILSA